VLAINSMCTYLCCRTANTSGMTCIYMDAVNTRIVINRKDIVIKKIFSLLSALIVTIMIFVMMLLIIASINSEYFYLVFNNSIATFIYELVIEALAKPLQ